MLKWLGAILLGGAALLTGRYFSQNMIQRRRELEAIVGMIGRMKDDIRYNGSDVCSLVRKTIHASLAAPLSFLSRCIARCDAGEPFPNAWRAALDESQKEMHLSQEEMTQLVSFGGRLGATDLEGQMAHCELYLREFARLLQEVRSQESIKSRLYRSLSMLACAAVIILSV